MVAMSVAGQDDRMQGITWEPMADTPLGAHWQPWSVGAQPAAVMAEEMQAVCWRVSPSFLARLVSLAFAGGPKEGGGGRERGQWGDARRRRARRRGSGRGRRRRPRRGGGRASFWPLFRSLAG